MRVSTTEIFLVDVSFIQYVYGFRYLNIQSIRKHTGQETTCTKVLELLKKVPKVEDKPERNRI